MKKKKNFRGLAITAVVIFAVLLLVIRLKNIVIVKKVQNNNNFSSMESADFGENYVKDAKTALAIFKAFIRSVYDESPLFHGPYTAYFNAEKNQWEVEAVGGIIDPGIYAIIDAKNGAVLNILHYK